MTKSVLASRTLLANVTIAGLATWFDRSRFYVSPLWFIWAIAAANIGLRLLTTRPLRWPGRPLRQGDETND